MNSHFQEIGSRIRAARDCNGLSQSHVAEIAGVDRTYIGKIERGEVNFSVGILIAIADALDVRPSELLGDKNGG